MTGIALTLVVAAVVAGVTYWLLGVLTSKGVGGTPQGLGGSSSTQDFTMRVPLHAPAGPEALAELERGAGLMGQFEFQRAEEAFRHAQSLAPTWWIPQFNVAVAVLNQTSEGAQERAIALLEPLKKVPQAKQRAEYCTALALMFLGKPAEALPIFQGLATAHQQDAYAQFFLAQSLELAGDLPAARQMYERAASLDPLLRSSYLGVQRTADRTGDGPSAAAALAVFRALSEDPRSTLAEFKYSRMGPLSSVVVEDGATAARSVKLGRTGVRQVFGAVEALSVRGLPAEFDSPRLTQCTTVDLDDDSRQDLVFTGGKTAPGLVCLAHEDGMWSAHADHPLATLQADGLLWADLNNDGHVDAVVNAASGESFAMIQRSPQEWVRHPLLGGGQVRCLALADLDHDGDIDVVASEQGVCVLLMNRSDLSFERRPLQEPATAHSELGAESKPLQAPVVRAVVADLDGDLDLDLMLIRQGEAGPRAEVWQSGLLWDWKPAPHLTPQGAVAQAVPFWVGDVRSPHVACIVFSEGSNKPDAVRSVHLSSGGVREQFVVSMPDVEWLTVCDVEGTGTPLIVAAVGGSQPEIRVLDLRGEIVQRIPGTSQTPVSGAFPAMMDSRGLVVVLPAVQRGAPPRMLVPGDDRLPSAVVTFRGRTDPSQQMRSNASGIGTAYTVRTPGSWGAGWSLPITTAGGGVQQSLQPVSIGLAGHSKASFVWLQWSDGVVQSELDLKAGVQVIQETQRQISSCPVIFAWNGKEHAFVTDCLGVGGMGYLVSVERGAGGALTPVYAPPRPWERVILGDESALAPLNGRYEIRVGEPMEEACYLDACRLVAYDLPSGWYLAVDERMGINGPPPTGKPLPYQNVMLPSGATADGVDATRALTARDGVAAHLGAADSQFIGRLQQEAIVELCFPESLLSHAGSPMLLIDGWVEYPYCQTNFAMWQSGLPYQAPTVQALDPASGQWVDVVREYGYPAGMPRQACLPLPVERIPPGCTRLRLLTTMEIYFDRIQLAWHEECPGMMKSVAALDTAECAFAGFPQRVHRPQRRPDYQYSKRAPLWDCRLQPGWYTQFGECTPLLAETDDTLAIFGAGEEVRLRFQEVPPASAGTKRTWVLELDGWCKDMDRFTGAGHELEPLPLREGAQPGSSRAELHKRFNTRFAAGQ